MTENPYDELPTESPEVPTPSARVPWGCLVAVIGIGVILVLLLLPAVRRNGQVAHRFSSKNNLREIMLAIHNYHDIYDAFPPAYTTDAAGNRLHSWRTLILPYMEQEALYRSIDLSKPWNDPANAMAYQTSITTFECEAADLDECQTIYHGLIGEDTLLHPTKTRHFDDITDGTSNTIAVVEVLSRDAIHWMSPHDRGLERFLNLSESSETPHRGGVQAGRCDGTVRFISNRLSKKVRAAITTIQGGEEVNDFF